MNNHGAYVDFEGALYRVSYIEPWQREGVFAYCAGCQTARPLTALVQYLWMAQTHEATAWVCGDAHGLGLPRCLALADAAVGEMYAVRNVAQGTRN